ncbi:uncharacterized protein LOC132195208 [Neocloeon triangulifer]|uniref:uncharacterized protein LOC132195208 n=1 Tax=Neocloeon triangulifer TaxID=2078957 RepID=UPI00286EBF30|nr:uncharacterized protein LOC132195208 [Neocloeon triangulifer]
MGWYVRHSTNKAVAVASYLDPEMGYTGNGYYHGTGNFGLHYQSVPGSCSPLLLAPGLRHEANQEFSDDEKGQRAIVAEGIDFSNYIAVNVPLYDTVNRIGVCSGTEFCCSLTYKAENVVPDTHFQLVAFEGNRYASDGTVLFPEQTCGLVACSGWDRSTCGASKNETLYAKEVRFLNLTLVGSFSTDRVIVNTIDGAYDHEKWFYPLSDPRQTNFRLTTNGDRYDAEISNIQPISIKMFGLTSTDYNV